MVNPQRQEAILQDFKNNDHQCEDGWFKGKVTGSCYLVTNELTNWNSGKETCSSLGSELAQVESDYEQKYLQTVLTESVWIGANDNKQEGTFVWNNQANFIDENKYAFFVIYSRL